MLHSVTEQGVAVPAPHIVGIAHVSIGHRGMLTDDSDTTARGYFGVTPATHQEGFSFSRARRRR